MQRSSRPRERGAYLGQELAPFVSAKTLTQALVATGSYDQTVRFWDLRSQSRHALQVLDDFGDSVTSLAIAKGAPDARGGKRGRSESSLAHLRRRGRWRKEAKRELR